MQPNRVRRIIGWVGGPYQIKENGVLLTLMFLAMAIFPHYFILIGALTAVLSYAVDDLSWTAFSLAVAEDTIKQTAHGPVAYFIEPACKFKWLVWRQATISAEWYKAHETRR